MWKKTTNGRIKRLRLKTENSNVPYFSKVLVCFARTLKVVLTVPLHWKS